MVKAFHFDPSLVCFDTHQWLLQYNDQSIRIYFQVKTIDETLTCIEKTGIQSG